MIRSLFVVCAAVVVSATAAFSQSGPIEPDAGAWKTWVITSGKDFRVPPPPDAPVAEKELAEVRDLLQHNDTKTAERITYWDAGSPGYRWIESLNERVLSSQALPPNLYRIHTYLTMAIYDATIAAWESKTFYNRLRPGKMDPALATALPTPRSPSYPSEHAAAAGAAATVLSYFFPAEAPSFAAMAEEAARSRVLAGLQYPSDMAAGLELGKRVGEEVIARAKTDGSDYVWTGTVPTGPCKWIGTKPGNVTLPKWKPLLLASPDELRSPPPPDCKSPTVKADADEVRNFTRTFPTNYKAFFWQSPVGITTIWYDYASKWIFEEKIDTNPPRAARVYAMLAGVYFDAFIASNDGKYAYWYLRPHQLDAQIVPLFPVPNFPTYPSNHSTLSSARGEVLAYLFPSHAGFIRAVAKEAGDSRVWAGIHYQMDNVSGVVLGKAVAAKFIERAKTDGAD